MPLSSHTLGTAPGIPARILEPRPLHGLERRFGNLLVRRKLIVLHNLFFLLLTFAVYLTVTNVVSTRINAARSRELALILNTFSSIDESPRASELEAYDLRAGSAADFGLSDEAQTFLTRFPNRVWQLTPTSEHVYKLIPHSTRLYRLTLPLAFYADALRSLRLALSLVLGVIYLLAVLVLELLILPRFVYQPLRLLLAADQATRDGDRTEEIIPDTFITNDEIGQILLSHNTTVRALRRHEDELEAAKHNLEAQDRLVSLGLLSASVAHEMNTPLAVLHGSVEKLLETVPDPAARPRLERMLRVTERLRRISESLLDFARLRRQALQSVPLAPLLDEAWHLVSIDDKAASVSFSNSIPPTAAALANPDRLMQVFVNLLRNALQSAPASGGAIRVSGRPAHLAANPAFTVIVEDNGPGIPPEVLPDIFDAFVTTRLDSQGTGLGLAVAEGIVDQHGGAIHASNCPSGGARLEVTLPLPQDAQ